MTVVFKELGDSPIETFGPEGMGAERRFLVEKDDRRDFVTELLGEGYPFGSAGLADYPGTTGVVAMRVRMEPFTNNPDHQGTFDDVETDLNVYTSIEQCAGGFDNPYLITANYEVLLPVEREDFPQPEDGTFLTYRMDFGGKFIESPTPACIWEGAPDIEVPPAQAIGQTVRVPQVEHHITWHRVFNPPWAAISDQIGTLNDALFGPGLRGQVLFDGCVADKEFTWQGDFLQPHLGWKISYVFKEFKLKVFNDNKVLGIGWNHVFRFNGPAPAWDRLLIRTGPYQGSPPYSYTDFRNLFRFAATN